MIELDEWQQQFIEEQGNKILVAGRQTGKSEGAAYDNAEFCAKHPGTTALILSKTERQAEELLIKVLNFMTEKYPKRIGHGKLKPLKHCVYLMHPKGKPSRVMCLPTGLAAEGIRGYTIDKLTIDEAQLVSDDVYNAILPMLLTTNGKVSLLGTPQGKRGFFWEAYQNTLNHFRVFHVNSEEVINNRKVSLSWAQWRKDASLEHLKRERARMSPKWYAQEYLGVFVEDLRQFFDDETIKSTCILKRRHEIIKGRAYFGGSDIASLGADISTFEILDRVNREKIVQVENQTTRKTFPHQTAEKIISLNSQYGFKKYGVDDGGMGVAVLGLLLKNSALGQKVVALNNSRRVVSLEKKELSGKVKQSEKGTKLLKEAMYFNLLNLMHSRRIQLLDDEEIILSFKSVQYEIDEETGKLIIFGNDTHIVEGIMRAAWLAEQDKTLNIYVA